MFNNMKMKYRLVITDTKTGKLVRRTRWRNSRSFVLQFLKLLQVSMEHETNTAGTTISVTDTGNTARNMQAGSSAFQYYWGVDAPAANGTYGILVGTDNTGETNSDYALGTQIADGNGAGQLDHSSHTWIDAAVVGANVDMYIQRPFINNSGGAITIQECGIYIAGRDTGLATRIFCIVRDTTGGVTVNNGQTCTVEYLFRTTV